MNKIINILARVKSIGKTFSSTAEKLSIASASSPFVICLLFNHSPFVLVFPQPKQFNQPVSNVKNTSKTSFSVTSILQLSKKMISFLIALGYQLRLKGAPVPHAGRLELLYKGVWGTIRQFHHYFSWGHRFRMTPESTRVICRQLGFSDAILSTGWSVFGPGTGPQWFTAYSLRCSGSETNIMNCTLYDRLRFQLYGSRDTDVSVVCQPNDPPANGKQQSQIRLLFRVCGFGTLLGLQNYDDL